jgi:hypothetical protein
MVGVGLPFDFALRVLPGGYVFPVVRALAARQLTTENEAPSRAIAEQVLTIMISVLTNGTKFCLAQYTVKSVRQSPGTCLADAAILSNTHFILHPVTTRLRDIPLPA